MVKSLLGILVAGLVVGCAMEEPDSSGALTINPDNDVEVPAGLTARDFDFNNDKIIDIRDLVIVSRFFGQEISDESSETTTTGYELPELPEFVYTMVELEQTHWYTAMHIKDDGINVDYAKKIQVAMRIQLKRLDKDQALDYVQEHNIIRSFPVAYKHLDGYWIPEIKIKIINDPGTKKLPYENYTLKPAMYNSTPLRSFNEFCWKNRHLTNEDIENNVVLSRTTAGNLLGDGIARGSIRGSAHNSRVAIEYILNARNLNHFRETSCSCEENCDSYHEMEKSLHTGKLLLGSSDDEPYTNAYISQFTFQPLIDNQNTRQQDDDDFLIYKFVSYVPSSGEGIGRLLTSQFIDEPVWTSQQEIIYKHFPDDDLAD